MGVAFYGVSEHFDYDVSANKNLIVPGFSWIDADAYFHTARHLQEDYQGVMNVFIGAEFGYTTSKTAQEKYLRVVERFSPDFIVNSIHTMKEQDYYFGVPYRDQKGNVREKREVYKEYLALVEESLQAPYPYDIVAHLGYVVRYGPYQDKSMPYQEYAKEFDKILKTVIQKDKILEVNAKDLTGGVFPMRDVLERYYALGGRNVSYGSDAHDKGGIMNGREEAVKMLKEIGFSFVTVPDCGKHLQVEI